MTTSECVFRMYTTLVIGSLLLDEVRGSLPLINPELNTPHSHGLYILQHTYYVHNMLTISNTVCTELIICIENFTYILATYVHKTKCHWLKQWRDAHQNEVYWEWCHINTYTFLDNTVGCIVSHEFKLNLWYRFSATYVTKELLSFRTCCIILKSYQREESIPVKKIMEGLLPTCHMNRPGKTACRQIKLDDFLKLLCITSADGL